jgi:hypothetical protein
MPRYFFHMQDGSTVLDVRIPMKSPGHSEMMSPGIPT